MYSFEIYVSSRHCGQRVRLVQSAYLPSSLNNNNKNTTWKKVLQRFSDNGLSEMK